MPLWRLKSIAEVVRFKGREVVGKVGTNMSKYVPLSVEKNSITICNYNIIKNIYPLSNPTAPTLLRA